MNGLKLNLYEVESIRIANKFSLIDTVVVRFVKTPRFWFSTEGKLIKKVEDTMIEGRYDLSRETTEYGYDPKIEIETPIK